MIVEGNFRVRMRRLGVFRTWTIVHLKKAPKAQIRLQLRPMLLKMRE